MKEDWIEIAITEYEPDQCKNEHLPFVCVHPRLVAQAIRKELKARLPKNMGEKIFVGGKEIKNRKLHKYDQGFVRGFNKAIQEMRDRIG